MFYLQYQSDFKKILRALCNFFDHQNQTLVIFSLRIFTSLCLNESEGQKVIKTLKHMFI